MTPPNETGSRSNPNNEHGSPALSGAWTFNLGVTVWVAMFASILIWNIGEVKVGTIGNTGNYYRITLVAFSAVAGLLGILLNGNRISRALSGPLVLLGIYGVYAMVSALYVPEYALYSMWKALEVIIDVVAIGVILCYANSFNAAMTAYRVILTFFVFLIFLYWAEAAIWPDTAFAPYRGVLPYAMHGILPATNGNALAFMGALVGFSCWCRASRPATVSIKLFYWGIFLVAMATLVMAQSRTSLFGFLGSMVVFFLFTRRYMSLAAIGILLLAGWLSTSFLDVAREYVVRGQSEELFTSLSGRTKSWQAAWDLFKESPITGHGFAAAARLEVLGTGGASTLHGAIFDVLVGVGLIGLVPWLAAIIWASMRVLLLTNAPHPWMQSTIGRSVHAEMLGVLTLVLLRNITSSGLALHEHSFMVFLCVLAYGAALRREVVTYKTTKNTGPANLSRLNA